MLEAIIASLDLIVLQTQANATNLAVILLLPWTAFILTRLNKHLLLLGIIPRTRHGLIGIIFCPLLHKDFNHLFFNSIPLVILSDFILMQGLDYFLDVTLFITLLSGFLIWCFGKKGIHIGASALISGYWSFLMYASYVHFTVTSVILGAICIYYFAPILFSALPGNKGVSWEGHLFGLIAGVIAQKFLLFSAYFMSIA